MKELLKQAAVIRDEVEDYKNSAERVGILFVDVIQRMQKIVSDEQIKIDTLKVIADENSVKVYFDVNDEVSGQIIHKAITYPIVSDTKAGLLTSEQFNDFNQRISKITPLFISESKFEELKESGKLDSEKFYYIYEES